MQVAVEPFNFLLLPANIQYFSVLINGQLSKGCRFDALHDLRDTRLALLCLICKVSDVFRQPLTFLVHCIVKTGVCHQTAFLVSTIFSFEIGLN